MKAAPLKRSPSPRAPSPLSCFPPSNEGGPVEAQTPATSKAPHAWPAFRLRMKAAPLKLGVAVAVLHDPVDSFRLRMKAAPLKRKHSPSPPKLRFPCFPP